MKEPSFLMGVICGIMIVMPGLLVLWIGESNDKDS
jgi:hypothetical protein